VLTTDTAKPKIFVDVIESMRGIAALGVVCYHFTHGTIPSMVPNSLSSYFIWARMGIPAFFIISGFVIPYAMYSAGYTLRDAGRFMLKRLVRMAPPAWCALALIFVFYYGALAYKGSAIEGMTWPGVAPKTIIANLFFSFNLFEVKRFIEIFWTLEVELHFYIFIAITLPFIIKHSKNQFLLSLFFIALTTTYYIDPVKYIFFGNNAFFIMGILLFLYRMKLITRNYFAYATGSMLMLSFIQTGLSYAAASLISILIIAFVRFNNPVTDFLGMISYSLYITHHISGTASELFLRNLYGPDPSEPLKVLMFCIYLAIAISFAYIFYMLIEKPSLALSKKISIRKKIQPKFNLQS
jgi:peptidoglycan/LPS O-acetylase OafA/YrhL